MICNLFLELFRGDRDLLLLTLGWSDQRVKVGPRDSLKSVKESMKVLNSPVNFLQPILAVVNRPAVMRGKQEKAQSLRLMALEKLSEDNFITLAF